jgi:hypothetical protein
MKKEHLSTILRQYGKRREYQGKYKAGRMRGGGGDEDWKNDPNME